MSRTTLTIRRIRRLRKRVQAAKSSGACIDLKNPTEYIFIANALELLIGALEAERALQREDKEAL